MKYIIMCGGNYPQFKKPKQLLEVAGEILVERTIRLLKENGITDIAISTNNPAFDYLNVEKLRHENDYLQNDEERNKKSKKSWLNAYYPTEEPACYLHGDVYYSDNSIKKIINTEIKETMFFAVPDVTDGRKSRNIKGREPLAYKVQNQKKFRKAINDLFYMIDKGMFESDPICWNLYRQINNIKLDYYGYGNDIFFTKGDFIAIDDYSTDIDSLKDIPKMEKLLEEWKGGIVMVKVESLRDFNLNKKMFYELKNLKRRNRNEDEKIFVGDTFECTEAVAEYFIETNPETKKDPNKRPFVKILEIIPEEKTVLTTEVIIDDVNKNQVIEEKPKRRRRRTE